MPPFGDTPHRTQGEDLAALRAFLEASFVGLGERLDGILEQTTRTNGRVNKLEAIAAVHREQIQNLKDDRGHRSRQTPTPDSTPVTFGTLQKVVVAILATITMTVSVLIFLGWHK